MGNIFPAARLIELLLFGKTRLRIWTFAGVVMLPALLILTFLCVSIFNVARERFGYVHDSFHSMQRRKSIRRQKKELIQKTARKFQSILLTTTCSIINALQFPLIFSAGALRSKRRREKSFRGHCM